MESKFFLNCKIAKFQNIRVSTKLWKAQIVLPFLFTNNKREMDKMEKKSVWVIRKVMN
jgi:hypothetical protein